MKKIFLSVFLFPLVVWGWSFKIENKTPKCSDTDVMSLLKQISYENLEDTYALIILINAANKMIEENSKNYEALSILMAPEKYLELIKNRAIRSDEYKKILDGLMKKAKKLAKNHPIKINTIRPVEINEEIHKIICKANVIIPKIEGYTKEEITYESTYNAQYTDDEKILVEVTELE